MLDSIVLIVSTIAMSILGLFVLSRNIRDRTLQIYGALTLSAILWFVANYYSNHIKGNDAQLFMNRLSLFTGFLLIQSIWLLSLYFPIRLANHRLQRAASIFLTPLLLVITLFSGGIVKSIYYDYSKQLTDINTGSLYYFYLA